MESRVLRAGIVALLAAFCLSACQSTPPPRVAWARKDGQVMTGNPTLLAQGQSDEIQCKASAAQAAGSVSMPTSIAIGDYAGTGFGEYRQAGVQNSVYDNTMEACMDQRGYRLIVVPEGMTYTPPRNF